MNRDFISNSNYILRKILNKYENIDIIQDFIESILNINIERIILNPYLKSEKKYMPREEKFGIADVRITTDMEEENIGIQIIDGKHIKTKSLIYYSQIHLNQLKHDKRRKIVRTETINIIDCSYFKGEGYHKIVKIDNRNIEKENQIKLHFIELPKFKVRENKILNKEEEWVAFLKENYSEKEFIYRKNNKIDKLNKLLEKYWDEEKME